MLSINKEIENHMIAHVILAKVFSKKCANDFFQKANNFFKEKTIIHKSYLSKN